MTRDEKIKVLIADDSNVFQRNVAELIETQPDMEVVALASDGEEAMRMILEKKPDIALVDLLMPLRDGLGVLEEMQSKNIKYTSCILISAIGMDSIAIKAMALGAQYYIVKPYRSEFLLGRIRQIYQEKVDSMLISNELEKVEYLDQEHFHEPQENKSPEQMISHLLTQMNVSASIKGYYYLRNAILMVWKDQDAIIGITKRMYPDVAKDFHTTPNKVERAIRHAIESAWKRGGERIYSQIVDIECLERPTNGQFIATVSEYLRMNRSDSY